MDLQPVSKLSKLQIEARLKILEDLTERFESIKRKIDEAGDLSLVKQSVFATIRAGSVFQLDQYLSCGLFSVTERDYQLCSPLHVAAFEGRDDMVGVLIAHGADVFAVDKKGRTAKDVADLHRHSSISKRLLSLMSDLRGVDLVPIEENSLHSPLASTSEFMPVSQAFSSLSANFNFANVPQEVRASTFCTVSDDHSLILCLVGLPGRGKSFISRRLARYLNWKGVPCKVFNAGDYRRRFLGATGTSSADFFDPTNRAAKDAREKMAELATEDLIDFIHTHPICVGILDATNTTRERRALLLERFRKLSSPGDSLGESVGPFTVHTQRYTTPVRVVFLESICNDEKIITENILRAKCGNDDFKGVSPQTVISEFRDRIHQYEKVYESLDCSENGGRISFIQIIDAKQRIVLHNVKGALPSRVAYFLTSLHPVAYPVYICLPAETVGDVSGHFDGDSRITQNGIEYIGRLRAFIRARLTAQTGSGSLRLLCSHSPAVDETVGKIINGLVDGDERIDLTTIQMRALDNINYGAMAGLTPEEAMRRHPRTCGILFQPPETTVAPPFRFESRESQPDFCPHDCSPMPTFSYTVSFVRGGESTRQVNVRIEPALLEIMRADGPAIVIADPTPAKGVLAFMTDELPEHNQRMFIPRHGVVEVGVKSNTIIHQL